MGITHLNDGSLLGQHREDKSWKNRHNVVLSDIFPLKKLHFEMEDLCRLLYSRTLHLSVYSLCVEWWLCKPVGPGQPLDGVPNLPVHVLLRGNRPARAVRVNLQIQLAGRHPETDSPELPRTRLHLLPRKHAPLLQQTLPKSPTDAHHENQNQALCQY